MERLNVLKTLTIDMENQIHHQGVLQCAIQEMKTQYFMYFEICKTANLAASYIRANVMQAYE